MILLLVAVARWKGLVQVVKLIVCVDELRRCGMGFCEE